MPRLLHAKNPPQTKKRKVLGDIIDRAPPNGDDILRNLNINKLIAYRKEERIYGRNQRKAGVIKYA